MKFAYSMKCGKINTLGRKNAKQKTYVNCLAVLMATVISSCDESNSLPSSNNNSTSNVIINEVTEAIWKENLTIENNNFTMKC